VQLAGFPAAVSREGKWAGRDHGRRDRRHDGVPGETGDRRRSGRAV